MLPEKHADLLRLRLDVGHALSQLAKVHSGQAAPEKRLPAPEHAAVRSRTELCEKLSLDAMAVDLECFFAYLSDSVTGLHSP